MCRYAVECNTKKNARKKSNYTTRRSDLCVLQAYIAFGDKMSYLLKHNRVIFPCISEELSENNHLYFSSGIFQVGAQGQIQLLCVCVDLKCILEGFLLFMLCITDLF